MTCSTTRSSVSQAVSPSTTAVARLGSFRTFQAPISDIAALAGIDFGALVSADVLPVSAARKTAWTELALLSDVTL